MTAKTSRWDITEHRGTEAEIAAYLEAVFEDGDADEIRRALGESKNPTFAAASAVLKVVGVRLPVAE
jgi:DNA-binding phage protein